MLKVQAQKTNSMCLNNMHTLLAERRVGQVVEKMNHKYQKHRFRFKKNKKSEGDTLAN